MFIWLASIFFSTHAWAADPDLRLLNAVTKQDTPAVRVLLNERIDVNAVRADGVTALLYAAHLDDLEIVEMLLGAGARVNVADDHGVTPLARACENANLVLVDRLLAAGAQPNLAQQSGLTPLMIAARTGSADVIKTLLARGATVNARTVETRESALLWALAGQHHDAARLLLDAGADIRSPTAKGITPLLITARNGDVAMAKALMARGIAVDESGADGTHPLPFAILNGQVAFAEFLLAQGANPNGAMGGVSALHTAISGAVDLWLADWNLKHGAGVRSGKLLTPDQRAQAVHALLGRGADPNTRTTTHAVFMNYLAYPWKGAFEPYSCGTGSLRGATPLWMAANAANGSAERMGRRAANRGATAADRLDPNVELMRTLMTAGADPHLATQDGTTPLMVAAGLGRCTNDYTLQRGARSTGGEQAVSLLLDAGVDVNGVNEADFTALHGAAFRGLNEIIQILVDRGGNINARDYRGRTPHRLAEGSKQSFYFQGYPGTTEFIKSLGANVHLGLPGAVQERLRSVVAGDAQEPNRTPVTAR